MPHNPQETAKETAKEIPQEAELSHFGNSNLWYPPEDRDKPAVPYLPGLSVEIVKHEPPPESATVEELEGYPYHERPNLSEEYLRTVTHSEAVVLNPPVDGIQARSSPAETAQLPITKSTAIGPARGAQVVAACKVALHAGDPFVAVAKIYDPLYYNSESSSGIYPRDCIRGADDDREVETWAYGRPKQTCQIGCFAPE